MKWIKSIHIHKPILPRIILAAVFFLSYGIAAVSAQSAADGVVISNPDLSQYPMVSLTFRIKNAAGEFVKDLQPLEVEIHENNLKLSASNLELLNPGVKFTVVVNEGPTLANRYSGVSRFERIKTALYNWISTHDSQTPDEFSLVTNQGAVNIVHTNPASWSEAVEAYAPDLRNMQPGLASITSAVDNIISAGITKDKSIAILYVTPLPYADQFDELEELFNRASENGIHIFVWLVGPQDYATNEDSLKLKGYAESTGGSLYLFSGSEELPALSSLLDPLSYLYKVTYKTDIVTSGENTLSLRIQKNQTVLESQEVAFTLNVSAPNPFFLSPPSEITRSWTETRRKRDSALTPNSETIQVMIEFPDGMPRELAYSRLFVDNMLVDENTIAPFDTFTWDISKIIESGSHTLQVLIEDAAGLKGETIVLPVEVIVLEQPMTAFERVFSRINIVNGIVGGTLVALVIGGIAALMRVMKARKRTPIHKSVNDPVSQPVEIAGEYSLAPSSMEEKIEWPVIRGTGLAAARLIRKSSSGQDPDQPQEIALSGDEITIGSERKKADVILTHPTVSNVHARIFKDADGNFRVADAGSNAGTWVNYAPISSHGARLEHGDLVQFGRVAYIFEVHGVKPRRIQVLPYRED